MAYEQRDNSGSLFLNDRKEKETHPSHTGTALIDGVEYYISAWVKEGNNKKFFSMAFKPKQAKAAEEPYNRPAPTKPKPADLNDEIPFTFVLGFVAYAAGLIANLSVIV